MNKVRRGAEFGNFYRETPEAVISLQINRHDRGKNSSRAILTGMELPKTGVCFYTDFMNAQILTKLRCLSFMTSWTTACTLLLLSWLCEESKTQDVN